MSEEKSCITLKNKGLGSLQQISNMLWTEMNQEVERNGHTDLALRLEGAVYGIEEILEINQVKEEKI